MKNGIHNLMAAAGLLGASLAAGQDARPSVSFSGYVDADFVTTFSGGGVQDPIHTTGLEIDLTTTVTFSRRLNAVIYTTMNDGIVPAQGAGKTWDDVNFDGATLNWLYNDKLTIYAGDLIYGTGYFNYYGNKRSAVVVGEHAARGAGFSYGGLTVTTGVSDLGAADSTGPLLSRTWSTFLKYDLALGASGGTLTPSFKYTAGAAGATPFVGGLSYDGKFGGLSLSTDVAVNYYSASFDPGYLALFEPSFASGSFSIAATVFYNKKGGQSGDTLLAPNNPSTTLGPDAGEGGLARGKLFDDFFVYVEPGFSLSDTYALGLPLEYHQPDLDADGEPGEGIWVVPTFYVYPGPGVQWWLWAGVVIPTASGLDPAYSAGSEIIFKF
ncbi:MAG: hypothetical protein K0Q91_657 [Fibrobacteria bacterium]|jgi:hypothetical protein|nr:hypothetical protein [Fibrobacteria bacterium]